MKNKNYDYLVKLLILGDSGTGKSSLLLRYTDEEFHNTYITTIGIDFKVKTVTINGKKVRIQVWDTAGQERFRTITQAYYRGCNGVLVVYDCTDKDSFDHVTHWIKDLNNHTNDNVSKILVGNKSDLVDERVIKFEDGKVLAESYNINFFETSAKTGNGVHDTFNSIISNIVHIYEINNLSNKTDIINDDNNKSSKNTISCCKN